MILPSDSILRNPPQVISPKQILVFNAIRYSIDICEISFNRLMDNLDEFDKGDPPTEFTIPNIFLDVWSVINNSVIFMKIICREFQISPNEKALAEIKKAKDLRDSNQHIDERLREKILSNELPVYGRLNWRNHKGNNKAFYATLLYSGTFTSKEKISMTISNRTDVTKLIGNINMLEFSDIIREKIGKKWIFREESVVLDQIMADLKKWIQFFDEQVNEQLKDHISAKRHLSDLVLELGPIETK